MDETPHPLQPSDPPAPQKELESTAILIKLAQNGDRAAENRLIARFYPRLRAIAHGQLPPYQRDLRDTDDLVQETFCKALRNMGRFENRRVGAFLAYLRQILLNEIRQEVRRKNRRPAKEALHDGHVDMAKGPDLVTAEREMIQRFERALDSLDDEDQRQAVILRIGFGFSYEEIAQDLGRVSAGAARQLISRGIAKIALSMSRGGGGGRNLDA